MSWLFILPQFVLAALLFLTVGAPIDRPILLLPALVAVPLALWAFRTMGIRYSKPGPEVPEDARLVEHGPYRFIRHPMYTALLMATGSFAAGDRSLYGPLLWAGLAVTLVAKALYEERLLTDHFPQYADYKRRTARFVPFVF